MAMTNEEATSVYQRGREITTNMAVTADSFAAYAASFEARGGAAAMPVYADDVLAIVTFNNQLQAFLTPELRAILSKYRLDF